MVLPVPLPRHIELRSGAPLGRRALIGVSLPSGTVGSSAAFELLSLMTPTPVGVVTDDGGADVYFRWGRPDGAPAPTGIDPCGGAPGREAYELLVGDRSITVIAASDEGHVRGAASAAQILARKGVRPMRIVDGPRFAWRGLSLDVARWFLTVEQVRRIIDLLAAYKLNVLHLHLSDAQAWRLQIDGWPRLTDPAHWPDGERAECGRESCYTAQELRELVRYAERRCVTVVPELDMPGHVDAAVRAYPDLASNMAPASGPAYLDNGSALVHRFVDEVLGQVTGLTSSRFVHLGGDEAIGMPPAAYREFFQRAIPVAHRTGRHVVAWQEVARSGALAEEDVIQAWTSGPVDREFAEAVRAGVSVLLSANDHVYLDRRYAEASLSPRQTAHASTLGFDEYTPRRTRDQFAWQPEQLVPPLTDAVTAGIEAAVWCESVRSFDDVVMLLLPRLAAVAEKAWTTRPTTWPDHRARLRPHDRWWSSAGLHGYYRSEDVFS